MSPDKCFAVTPLDCSLDCDWRILMVGAIAFIGGMMIGVLVAHVAAMLRGGPVDYPERRKR